MGRRFHHVVHHGEIPESKKEGYLNPVHVTAARPAAVRSVGNSYLLPVALKALLPADVIVETPAALRAGHLPLVG